MSQRVAEQLAAVREAVGASLVGQGGLVDALLTGLLAGGHLLIEGPPGVAKTTAVAGLAGALSLEFVRLQFTPDLLPADVIGTEVYRPQEGRFEVRKGPVFAQLVLADEINRAPAKVQSALLEAMQERQVTIAGQTLRLPEPFHVFATQNPLEQEGTYALPEAQADRFLMKVLVGWPSREEELAILDRPAPEATPAVMTADDLAAARAAAAAVRMTDEVKGYVVDLVTATRGVGLDAETGGWLEHGASPRATLAIAAAARARALFEGRDYATPHDAKSVATACLRHRVGLSYEAEADGRGADEVVGRALDAVAVP